MKTKTQTGIQVHRLWDLETSISFVSCAETEIKVVSTMKSTDKDLKKIQKLVNTIVDMNNKRRKALKDLQVLTEPYSTIKVL